MASIRTTDEMRNLNTFVIVMCGVFLVGNVLHSFKFMVRYVVFAELHVSLVFDNFYALVADTLLLVSQSLNLLFYYAFNRHFRRVFRHFGCFFFFFGSGKKSRTNSSNNNNNREK